MLSSMICNKNLESILTCQVHCAIIIMVCEGFIDWLLSPYNIKNMKLA